MRILILVSILFINKVAFGASAAARAVSVTGDVKVGSHEVRVGDEIAAGQMIRTGPNGAAKLLLADKSIVDLGKDTAFTIESSVPDVGSSTKLDFGMVRSSIQKKMEKKIKFQMRTKTAVLAVRGTEFIVRSGGSGTSVADQVTVRDGQVAVGQGGGAAMRMLNAGEQFSTVGRFVNNQVQIDTRQTTVTQIKPEAMAAIASQATVQDQTFIQSVEVPANGPGNGPKGAGDGTLAVAAAKVIKEVGGGRGPASTQDGNKPPPPPRHNPVGTLNNIDGSAAQNKVVAGIALRVTFQP
jgi:hypothetical protein